MTRKTAVAVFISLVLGTQIYAIIFQVDSWPVTTFPMYAWPRPADAIRDYQILARTKNGEELQVFTPRWRVSWGVYPHLIRSGNWDVVSNLALKNLRSARLHDSRFRETEIESLRVALTWARIDHSGQISYHPETVLNIDPETGAHSLP